MTKLTQRIITAAILLLVLLLVLFVLPHWARLVALGLFVGLAAWEWSGFLGRGLVGRLLWLAGCVLALVVVAYWPQPELNLPLFWLALAWWAAAFALVLRFPVNIPPLVTALCGILVLLPAWVAVLALLGAPDLGPQLLLLMLLLVWAADIGAYFFGRRLGRVRLAPRVSPGKTWEGAIGGLVCVAAVALAGAALLGLPPGWLVPAGLSVALISILGDLTVSMFKRNAGLKDSGRLFPGHGGVLDRLDSITAAAPLFALECSVAGLLAP